MSKFLLSPGADGFGAQLPGGTGDSTKNAAGRETSGAQWKGRKKVSL